MLRAVLDPNTKRIVYKDDGKGGAPAAGIGGNPGKMGAPASVTLPELSVGPTPEAAPAAAPQSRPASMMMGGGGMAPPTMAGAMSQGAAARAPVQADPVSPLGAHLSGLEKNYGLPQGYLAQIRAVESSNGKNLANPNSSARGPYQFINSTAEKMGLSMEDRMDEYKSAAAVAKMAAGDAAAFQKRTGQTPTGADLYGMHQQGQAGYLGLLNGKTPGAAAQSLNGAGGLSAEGQLNVIRNMYNKAKPDLPGDPTTPYGGGGGATLTNNAGSINQVSPVVTQGAAGAQGPDPAPAPAGGAQAPAAKFDGGILGLMKGDDYTGAGANKDFSGKMADFTGSSAFTSGIKGLMSAFGGGGSAPAIKAPGIQNLSPEDEANAPNMSLMQKLYAMGTPGRTLGGRQG